MSDNAKCDVMHLNNAGGQPLLWYIPALWPATVPFPFLLRPRLIILVSKTSAETAEVWDPTSCCLQPIRRCYTCCQTHSTLPTVAPLAAFLMASQHTRVLPVQHAPAVIIHIKPLTRGVLALYLRDRCRGHQQSCGPSRLSSCWLIQGLGCIASAECQDEKMHLCIAPEGNFLVLQLQECLLHSPGLI